MNNKKGSVKNLHVVFFVGFLLTVALALTSYIDSSFAQGLINVKSIGFLFSVGAILSILVLSRMTQMISKVGIATIFQTNALTYLVSVFGMLSTQNPLFFQVLFVVYIVSGVAMYFIIDILIEHFSTDNLTGKIRGFYLTIYNSAFMIGPLFAGFILKENSFRMVYLIAGIFIITMTLIYMRYLENIPITIKKHGNTFWLSFIKLSKNRDLWRVYVSSIMLYFFFSWMAIYIPIYLTNIIHFGWDKIGLMFGIMHVPYVLFEIPIGRLADRCKCEKEIISIGFVIIGISTAFLSELGDSGFFFWAITLAMTRLGASFVQVGTESYFFKKTTEKDGGLIAVFRNAAPIAYILGPLTATIFLSFVSFENLFIILGAIMILIIFVSLKIRNLKWTR